MVTHEVFIHTVRELAVNFARAKIDGEQHERLVHCKMVYGRGMLGLRGLTQYNAWKHTKTCDLVEICALGEESWIQLAGTTIHELAHVLAGPGAGHDKAWKDACGKLGLRRVFAAGTNYQLANFHPEVRMQLAQLDKPADGAPSGWAGFGAMVAGGNIPKVRICSAGVGTRGGKSRGPGSGSRLRKYVCDCGQIIRASTDTLEATHDKCGTKFQLQD